MDIALQSLQYLTLGLIPGGLYGEDDFPPLRFSGLETTEEGGSESHESESLKKKTRLRRHQKKILPRK